MTATTVSENEASVLCQALGARLKRARLEQNITQDDLAELSGLSRTAIKNAENAGRCTLETVARILLALKLTDQLQYFIPEKKISPIEVADHSKKKVRQRASGDIDSSNKQDQEW